jgi:hypothetical protein
MDGWDPDEEPTGEPHRWMLPRRNRPREAFDATRGTEYPDPASAATSAMGSRRLPASRRLRSAGRRVGRALGWVGALVFAPLAVGILAGAVAELIHL